MNTRSRLQSRAAIITMIAALGATAPLLTAPAQAKPKPQVLEIWPARRVLLVLPLSVSTNWNSDAALGQAIIPLAAPELQRELTETGKFSITLPYRFDPVLRRGLVEKRIAENDISALIATPTLATARPVIEKLAFDQPVMAADVKLEELRVGGTAKEPTVQLRVSGQLFEQGNPNPIKSVSITSDPMPGRTPSDRLRAAAGNAFSLLAAEFVAPPAAFDLPAPIEVAPPETAPAPGAPANGAPAPGAPATAGAILANPGTPRAATPAPMSPVSRPNPLTTAPGTPLVPMLPTGQPPLGVGAGPTGNNAN
jgi:hypothetical protein